MKRLWTLLLLFIFCVVAGGAEGVPAREEKNISANGKGKALTLVQADVCERMKGGAPVNPAIVFSSSLGSIYCFTSFDPVPKQVIVYHRWYRKDRLRAEVKLTLKPPRWSTFSSMRIRKSDRGPWRVNIIGPDGQVLKIIRFSITD